MAGVFEALGEPVRRHILQALAAGEAPAGAIGAAIQNDAPISQPAISQHLKVLRNAGLVNSRAEGTSRIYALDYEGLTGAMSWLAGLADSVDPFTQPLDALATEVARGEVRRRNEHQARPDEDSSDASRDLGA